MHERNVSRQVDRPTRTHSHYRNAQPRYPNTGNRDGFTHCGGWCGKTGRT